jgi:hypothetical protein
MKSKPLSVALFGILTCSQLLNAQSNPPRFELGPVLNTVKACEHCDFNQGGGGRITVNLGPFLATEVELTRPFAGGETLTSLAVKGTYRMEDRRWLRFAGMNVFGKAGPAFLNHEPPCYKCIAQRDTKTVFDFGGGIEVVPTSRPVAIRFDVTGFKFTEDAGFFVHQYRLFATFAVMFRFK